MRGTHTCKLCPRGQTSTSPRFDGLEASCSGNESGKLVGPIVRHHERNPGRSRMTDLTVSPRTNSMPINMHAHVERISGPLSAGSGKVATNHGLLEHRPVWTSPPYRTTPQPLLAPPARTYTLVSNPDEVLPHTLANIGRYVITVTSSHTAGPRTTDEIVALGVSYKGSFRRSHRQSYRHNHDLPTFLLAYHSTIKHRLSTN